MKKLKSDFKQGIVSIQIEHLDDLWYVSHLISVGDTLSGKTFRKVKIGETTDRKSNIVKKPIFLRLSVEKIEYTPEQVRASGKVEEGTEDVAKGSYHTFSIEIGSIITLSKPTWFSYQKKQLEDACTAKRPAMLIIAHDREEAYFAIMKQYGYEILTVLKGDVAKKEEGHKAAGSFYQEVIKQIHAYNERYQPAKIILASPAFFKEDLMKHCTDASLKKKIILATCSYVGKTSFDEILKREETKQALAEDRTNQELQLVDRLLTEVSKDNLAAYGIKEVYKTAEAGAISILLVTDTYLFETREKGSYDQVDKIMRLVDNNKGEIHIINGEHDGGKKLNGLGGIGAVLRYKTNY